MKLKNYCFSTPVSDPEILGSDHPVVVVNQVNLSHLEEDRDLNTWMRKHKFGELQPNFYQADDIELRTPEDVKRFLESFGMVYDSQLDQSLQEFLDEMS